MRLFVAIGFDDIALDGIEACQEKLRAASWQGRFSARANLHMTLAFLGEVAEPRVGDVRAAMDATVVPRMEVILDQVGSFRRDEGDIWWVGPSEKLVLTQLHDDLANHLAENGFELEKQAFRPHVTLARSVRCDHRPSTDDLMPEPVSAQVDAIRLMESKHVDGVLKYEELYKKTGTAL